MSVQVLYDSDRDQAVLICTTSDTAFGPVFSEISRTHGWTAAEVAEHFLRWLGRDAREFKEDELADAVNRFIAAEPLECRWCGCDQPATRYDVHGLANAAYDTDDPFCSEECRDSASEDADERQREAYYGASTPQTAAERGAAAAEEKRRLG